VRTLEGKLRIGASRKTVLEALAHAVVLSPPSGVRGAAEEGCEAPGASGGAGAGGGHRPRGWLQAEMVAAAEEMRHCWARHPNVEHIAAALLAGSWRELRRRCPLR
jgi:hypothetical protein